MTMERWDPFRDMLTLREAMDRLLQESFVRPGQVSATAERGWMPLDVSEHGDNFEVCAPMPGVKPDEVHISVTDGVLSIDAESSREDERHGDGRQWLVRERQQRTFHRAIRLPAPVSADQAQANFEDGVLTVTLPKSPEARPRRIPISSSTHGNGGKAQITANGSQSPASSKSGTEARQERGARS